MEEEKQNLLSLPFFFSQKNRKAKMKITKEESCHFQGSEYRITVIIYKDKNN